MATNSKISLAAATGIAFSAFFVGGNYTSTFHGLRALLLPGPPTAPVPQSADAKRKLSSNDGPGVSPNHLALQRQDIYDRGSVTFPPIAGIAASSFLYAAWQLPKEFTIAKQLYIAAACLNLAVAPFTLTVMKKTNSELHRRAELARRGLEEDESIREKRPQGIDRYSTEDLVRWWGDLNVIRASLPLLAIVSAMAALVC